MTEPYRKKTCFNVNTNKKDGYLPTSPCGHEAIRPSWSDQGLWSSITSSILNLTIKTRLSRPAWVNLGSLVEKVYLLLILMTRPVAMSANSTLKDYPNACDSLKRAKSE